MSQSVAALLDRRENLARSILNLEQELAKAAVSPSLRRNLTFRLDIQKRALVDVNRQIRRREQVVG